MCGIFACLGYTDVSTIILDALKNLEYRGYDSCGIALIRDENNKFFVEKHVGAPSENEWMLPEGRVGLGHTRWATHGGVSIQNAHPHTDCSGQIAVVHNGTITNFLELKNELKEKGHKFRSETDTEVIAHLMENKNLKDSIPQISKRIQGSYAIAAMNTRGEIVVVREKNPIFIGVGDGFLCASSDIPTLSLYCSQFVSLHDGEYAILRLDGYQIYSFDGVPKKRESIPINFNHQSYERNGFETFTEKEIFEQPQRLFDCSSGIDEARKIARMIENSEFVYICGSGTSFHAALYLSYLLSILGIRNVAVNSSEFQELYIPGNNLSIFLSQSGSTYDTLESLNYAKFKGAKTASIVNVVGSEMTHLSDFTGYTRAGPEIGVASTKNYLNQLYFSGMIFLELLKNSKLYREFERAPDLVSIILDRYKNSKHFQDIIYLTKNQPPIFIGSGINHPTALEASLKLKELSYINSAAYTSGELKHGPLALVIQNTPIIAINPSGNNRIFEMTKTNVEEAKARGAYCIGVGDLNCGYDAFIEIPTIEYPFSSILSIVPLQLLAVYTAKYLGRNVDKPRNLAKSVTVM